MTLPSWTREPLVHFLAAGALVFGLFALIGEEADPASRSISLDRAQVAALAQQYETLMGRPPSDAELDAALDQYVREEVLYREALRLGLDQDDAVVRRRLAQKMDLLASSAAETAQPTDDALEAWLREHPDRFASDARYSFDQLWWEEKNLALAAQAKLATGANWQDIGGMIELSPSVDDEPRALVASRYGRQFLAGLEALKPGEGWSAPLPSGFGWHLVRLRAVETSDVPPLAQIRQQVENDWRSATLARRRDEAYRVLREAYEVKIAR